LGLLHEISQPHYREQIQVRCIPPSCLCYHTTDSLHYFGEVFFWWGLYLFTLTGSIRNVYAVLGHVSITLLFQFISVPMREEHLEKRKPGYREDTTRKPALLPYPSALGKAPDKSIFIQPDYRFG
jgi:hypothetical protein